MKTTENQDMEAASEDGTKAEVVVHSLLKRVEDTTRTRPFVALAVAGGAGLVLARGLPRLGMMLLLGLGGAVGYAVLRARA
ncbi:MAG: hypothetical protein IAG13_28300 [Deltaproteobacteria bacterium]|nr:hypothetical protein [Nannocystaceae bacterium]